MGHPDPTPQVPCVTTSEQDRVARQKDYSRAYYLKHKERDRKKRAEHSKRWKVNHRDKYLALRKGYYAKHKNTPIPERRDIINNFRSQGCIFCHEMERCCLDAHHVDPSNKTIAISKALKDGISITRLESEIKKCICICSNCHRKIHAGILKAPATLNPGEILESQESLPDVVDDRPVV